MTDFTSINIEELNPPLIFPDTSAEGIFQDLKARMIALNPEYEAALNLESEELTIAFQQIAWRLSVHERDCNEGVLQQTLAFATGLNLDWQGEVKGGIDRHVIDPGDPEAVPPIDPTDELDGPYRRRIQLAPEGYSVAGPVGAYIYHALRADPRVKDAFAYENTDAQVVVPILSHEGSGEASPEILAAVTEELNRQFTRPLNDIVQVVSATVPRYQIDATLFFYNGPDRTLAFAQARERLVAFVDQRHRLGDDIPLSGIYAALHIPNVVSKVELRTPVDTLIVDQDQAAFCNPEQDITLIDGGVNV